MKNRTNSIEKKGLEFAFKIVHCYNYLVEARKDNYFSIRLLKSGSNLLNSIEEAQTGNSKFDYYTNLFVSQNEVQKTRIYLTLLKAAHFLETEKADELLKETDEYYKILTSILSSTGVVKISNSTNIH
jgi:four helix bundle protein